MATLIGNVQEFVRIFNQAAATDPISAAMLAMGTIFIGFSLAALGYLTLGAVVDLFIPDSVRRVPPRAGR